MRKSFAVWATRGGSFSAPLLMRPSRGSDARPPPGFGKGDAGAGRLLQPSSRAVVATQPQTVQAPPVAEQANSTVPRSDSQTIPSVPPTPQRPTPASAAPATAGTARSSSQSPSFGKASAPSLISRMRMFDRRPLPLPSAVSLQAVSSAEASAQSADGADHRYHLLTDGGTVTRQKLLDEEAELDRRSQIVPMSV